MSGRIDLAALVSDVTWLNPPSPELVSYLAAEGVSGIPVMNVRRDRIDEVVSAVENIAIPDNTDVILDAINNIKVPDTSPQISSMAEGIKHIHSMLTDHIKSQSDKERLAPYISDISNHMVRM